jgi:hypothetical protein
LEFFFLFVNSKNEKKMGKFLKIFFKKIVNSKKSQEFWEKSQEFWEKSPNF